MVNAVFYHTDGYDSILVRNGADLDATTDRLRDFIQSASNPDADWDNWYGYHGRDWHKWLRSLDDLVRVSDGVVAIATEEGLVVLRPKLWAERLQFYGLEDDVSA